MSTISDLVTASKFEEAIALPKESLQGRDYFFLVSAYLSLSKAQEAMDVILAHRDELYALDPLLTLKASFETRFVLNQYDEAEEDLKHVADLPYVSQEVEEALRALPKTIQATRFASHSNTPDLEELLQNLAAPSDDLMLLSTLNALRKVGELEDYQGLVEELLEGACHDDVKTYALMLLSAKGSTNPVVLIKGGKRYEVVPAKLGSPYGLPEYVSLRKKIEAIGDAGLSETAGELLDLYALIRYPERFVDPNDVEPFYEGLVALAHGYLGQAGEEPEAKAREYRDAIGKAIAENPPLLG